MPAPQASDVAAFLDRAGDSRVTALAGVHLPIVTQFVREYTRGKGFDEQVPNGAISAVIVSATARVTQNPDGTISETIADYSVRKTVFAGLSVIERSVLDAYRRRSA